MKIINKIRLLVASIIPIMFIKVKLRYFILLTFLVTLHAKSQTIKNGLIIYYPFNGNANDESGNNNNGIISGATKSTDRFGNANSSYYFDGNSYLNGKIDFQKDICISLWFKLTDYNAFRYPHLFSFGSESIHASILSTYANSSNCYGAIYSAASNNTGIKSCNSSPNLADGNWHHGVFIYSQSSRKHKVYIDSKLLTEDALNNKPNDYTFFDFGRSYAPCCQYSSYTSFKGYLDDILIYNRELKENEIIKLSLEKPSKVKEYNNYSNNEYSKLQENIDKQFENRKYPDEERLKVYKEIGKSVAEKYMNKICPRTGNSPNATISVYYEGNWGQQIEMRLEWLGSVTGLGSYNTLFEMIGFLNIDNNGQIKDFEIIKVSESVKKSIQLNQTLSSLSIVGGMLSGVAIGSLYVNNQINKYFPNNENSSSSYSNSSSNTNNSVSNKGNICDDYNNSSINSPSYKYEGDWRCDGSNCNIKHRDVRFDDGTFGKIHLTSSGYSIGWTYDYYKSEYYAIRALYFYEKCNKTTSIGKGKN
jgi:hypothetical protein